MRFGFKLGYLPIQTGMQIAAYADDPAGIGIIQMAIEAFRHQIRF